MEIKFNKISDIKAPDSNPQENDVKNEESSSSASKDDSNNSNSKILEINVYPSSINDIEEETEDEKDDGGEDGEDNEDQKPKKREKKKAELSIKIRTPMILDFKYPDDPNYVYNCSKIVIDSIERVVIKNLHFLGGIEIENSNVTFENCILQNDKPKSFVVFATKSSTVNFTNSKVIDSNYMGLFASESTNLNITNCEFTNTENISVFSIGSKVVVRDSNFHDTKTHGIFIKDGTDLRVKNCTFKNCGSACIYIDNGSKAKVKASTFSQLKRPAITICDSFDTKVKNCDISDGTDTTITVYNGNLVMSDTVIRDTRGNCIFATSSSHIEITGGSLSQSDYPAIIFVNGCDGSIKDLHIKDLNESGIVLRSGSTVKCENVSITNATNVGIKITDAENAQFKNCYVDNCGLDCVNICDSSTVKFNNCFIGNGTEYTFSIYTGSDVSIENSIIFGPFHKPACYIHRGGDAQVVGCGFARDKKDALKMLSTFPTITNPVLLKEKEKSSIVSNFVKPIKFEKKIDDDIFKINSKRPVFISKCCLFGEKKGFECYLNLEELNAIFEAEQAEQMTESELEDPNATFMGHLKPPKCITCGKVIRDFRLSTCGHSVYCQDCWNKLDPKPTNCPLCRTMITKAVQLFDESPENGKLCPICYSYPSNCYFIPCGHILCKKCVARIFYSSDSCPFCREPNVQVRRFVTYE